MIYQLMKTFHWRHAGLASVFKHYIMNVGIMLILKALLRGSRFEMNHQEASANQSATEFSTNSWSLRNSLSGKSAAATEGGLSNGLRRSFWTSVPMYRGFVHAAFIRLSVEEHNTFQQIRIDKKHLQIQRNWELQITTSAFADHFHNILFWTGHLWRGYNGCERCTLGQHLKLFTSCSISFKMIGWAIGVSTSGHADKTKWAVLCFHGWWKLKEWYTTSSTILDWSAAVGLLCRLVWVPLLWGQPVS